MTAKRKSLLQDPSTSHPLVLSVMELQLGNVCQVVHTFRCLFTFYRHVFVNTCFDMEFLFQIMKSNERTLTKFDCKQEPANGRKNVMNAKLIAGVLRGV